MAPHHSPLLLSPVAALCDMHPMRALFLIPRNPPPKLKSKKWYVFPVGQREVSAGGGAARNPSIHLGLRLGLDAPAFLPRV